MGIFMVNNFLVLEIKKLGYTVNFINKNVEILKDEIKIASTTCKTEGELTQYLRGFYIGIQQREYKEYEII
jgi:hypothetical protein